MFDSYLICFALEAPTILDGNNAVHIKARSIRLKYFIFTGLCPYQCMPLSELSQDVMSLSD